MKSGEHMLWDAHMVIARRWAWRMRWPDVVAERLAEVKRAFAAGEMSLDEARFLDRWWRTQAYYDRRPDA